MLKLSVWIHHLKDFEFSESYDTVNYLGPAMEGGASIWSFDLYEFAHSHGMVAVAGGGATVAYRVGWWPHRRWGTLTTLICLWHGS